MYYVYDERGLFVSVSDEPVARSTTVKPEPPAGHLAFWNFDHWTYARAEEVLREPPKVARVVTRYAFRARFTTEEKVAIELASLDQPSAPMPARAAAAQLRAFIQDLAVAHYVDLDLPMLRQAVQSLEAMGLLATGRAAEILDAPIQNHEVP